MSGEKKTQAVLTRVSARTIRDFIHRIKTKTHYTHIKDESQNANQFEANR